jgi:hypothetical protein
MPPVDAPGVPGDDDAGFQANAENGYEVAAVPAIAKRGEYEGIEIREERDLRDPSDLCVE